MMQLVRMCVMASVGMMALVASARSDDAPNAAANQVAGLFAQSCIRFAGDTAGLRDWANGTGLKALPTEAQKYFLHGLPGIVFDASNKQGKFVLISYDGGSCSVVAELASGPVVITDLERDMNDARIAFRMTGEKIDPEENSLTHREYLISQGRREWLLRVSIVKNAAGQVMLTASGN
jgi:hypothetical protein